MWANTLWPFSSSTRNMAFGRGSITVPSRTIASSLGLGSVLLPDGGVEWVGTPGGGAQARKRPGQTKSLAFSPPSSNSVMELGIFARRFDAFWCQIQVGSRLPDKVMRRSVVEAPAGQGAARSKEASGPRLVGS